ncbi:MAG TPA: Gfo/Idh/MocA family oxidoreductase [Thermoguttaceae bacterium]|nr:Gfo/Idh/MocA family oxidoreductase [Thermoguttaceae bacterium]
MANYTRRRFLEDSLLAAAVMSAAPASRVFAAQDTPSKGPNEKLSAMIVGLNGRGSNHIGGMLSHSDQVEITYLCDPDENVGNRRCDEVAKKQDRRPKWVADMREGFDDKSLDIVTIATPNHWHALAAIWAMQAGKDVYVEKPVCHNVTEGRRMVETARKYKKICQTGTQCRSMKGSVDAIQYVHDGKIGEMKLARGLCYKPRGSIGPPGLFDPPEGVDYNLWQGPATERPITRRRFHYDWHWQYHWGNGDMGNQGPHQMDLARWGLQWDSLSENVISYGGRMGYEDAGDVANTQVAIHNLGDETLVFEVRGLKTDPLRGAKIGVIFYGSKGYVVLTSYTHGAAFDLDGNQIVAFDGGGDHYGNFLDAVHSRNHEDLHADILEGHLSASLAHTGTISYRLGEEISVAGLKDAVAKLQSNDDSLETLDRTISHLEDNGVDLAKTKLTLGPMLKMDPKSETFLGNDAANAMLTREYREPFVVPAAGEV